jgi:hypothetical protein
MQHDPYADIPAAPEFQLTSSTLADVLSGTPYEDVASLQLTINCG